MSVNLTRFQGRKTFASSLGPNKYLAISMSQQMISYSLGKQDTYCWPKGQATF